MTIENIILVIINLIIVLKTNSRFRIIIYLSSYDVEYSYNF